MLFRSKSRFSRRDLLQSAAAAAALSTANMFAQPGKDSVPGKGNRRIDVHHHMMPPFIDLWRERKWSPEVSLEAMDKFGTETAILSVTGLQPLFADLFYENSEKTHKFVRQCNDFGGKTASDNRKRFGFFGCLPLLDPELSLKEIEYVMDSLKADGIGAVEFPSNSLRDPNRVRSIGTILEIRAAQVDGPNTRSCEACAWQLAHTSILPAAWTWPSLSMTP